MSEVTLLTTKELRIVFESLGACYPALMWIDQQLEENPEVTPQALWAVLVKMRRSPEELEYDKERRKEDPTWKPSPEAHTGWGWISWVTHRAHMACGNGTFSGRRKIHDGPNADAVVPEDVLRSISTRWGWIARGEEEPDVG